ncbi:hypothetical protein CYY_008195 [Polysphondylium violaceum]|uniref:Uncharacterized protein n=1 Tax=Polysphondylium violaceum TaxID=133409 RepID=A0A8J4V486_9MYCE|nr:hypothetical protein CYY_008195 [Polysphondylium violaceum]
MLPTFLSIVVIAILTNNSPSVKSEATNKSRVKVTFKQSRPKTLLSAVDIKGKNHLLDKVDIDNTSYLIKLFRKNHKYIQKKNDKRFIDGKIALKPMEKSLYFIQWSHNNCYPMMPIKVRVNKL